MWIPIWYAYLKSWNTAILFSILMIVVIGKLRSGIRKKDQKNSFFNLAQFQLQSPHVTVKPLLEQFLWKRSTILRCVKEFTFFSLRTKCQKIRYFEVTCSIVGWIKVNHLVYWRISSQNSSRWSSAGVLVSLKLILRMTELFKVVTWPLTVESTVWYSLELTETKKNSF